MNEFDKQLRKIVKHATAEDLWVMEVVAKLSQPTRGAACLPHKSEPAPQEVSR